MIYHIKKLVLVLITLFYALVSVGQSVNIDLKASMLNTYDVWKKGTEVNIKRFVHSTSQDNLGYIYESFYLVDEVGNRVNISSKVASSFDFHYENIQQLWDAAIVTNVLHSLVKNGFNYQLRREMENDALDYIQTVRKYGLELNDPYLETYIYSLIAKIAPAYMLDGRPCSINLIIQQNPSINACCYPNGTIVLNTGLLATLHSEAELVAILSHEIAHFILDHSVQNVILEQQRQARAEFWAALATGLTAVAEIAVAANNDYYVPGAATMAVAAMSTSIATEVIDRLGMNYNHDQEDEADRMAINVLRILGYDSNALATALTRLEDEYINERNNAMYLSSYTHPSLIDRISRAGTPVGTREKKFEQIISFAVSNVAMMKYSDCRFRQCLPYVSQNIENNVATSDDYILKANCLLSTKNDPQSNLEVLSLIDKAKLIAPNNINIHKTEIIATLRMDDKIKAIELLNNYMAILDSYNLDEIKSDDYWDAVRQFVNSEKKWASQMALKLSGM